MGYVNPVIVTAPGVPPGTLVNVIIEATKITETQKTAMTVPRSDGWMWHAFFYLPPLFQCQMHVCETPLTMAASLVIHVCMTDVITFRPKRPKRELQRSFGNLSEKINELIERELAAQAPSDWRQILHRPRPRVTDEDYARCLKPE